MEKTIPENHVPKKRDRTASREARRKQLIEATIESIAIHGFNKTTLNTVTEIAKLSHGTVNFHFKSKDLLLLETMQYLIDEHTEHWKSRLEKAGNSPQEKLQALISTDFDTKIITPKRLAVWFAYWGEVSNRPAYAELAGKKDDERFLVIMELCDQIKKNGNYSHIDSKTFAHNLESLIDGVWLTILLNPKELTNRQAQNNCLTFIASTFPDDFKFPDTSGATCSAP